MQQVAARGNLAHDLGKEVQVVHLDQQRDKPEDRHALLTRRAQPLRCITSPGRLCGQLPELLPLRSARVGGLEDFVALGELLQLLVVPPRGLLQERQVVVLEVGLEQLQLVALRKDGPRPCHAVRDAGPQVRDADPLDHLVDAPLELVAVVYAHHQQRVDPEPRHLHAVHARLVVDAVFAEEVLLDQAHGHLKRLEPARALLVQLGRRFRKHRVPLERLFVVFVERAELEELEHTARRNDGPCQLGTRRLHQDAQPAHPLVVELGLVQEVGVDPEAKVLLRLVQRRERGALRREQPILGVVTHVDDGDARLQLEQRLEDALQQLVRLGHRDSLFLRRERQLPDVRDVLGHLLTPPVAQKPANRLPRQRLRSWVLQEGARRVQDEHLAVPQPRPEVGDHEVLHALVEEGLCRGVLIGLHKPGRAKHAAQDGLAVLLRRGRLLGAVAPRRAATDDGAGGVGEHTRQAYGRLVHGGERKQAPRARDTLHDLCEQGRVGQMHQETDLTEDCHRLLIGGAHSRAVHMRAAPRRGLRVLLLRRLRAALKQLAPSRDMGLGVAGPRVGIHAGRMEQLAVL